MLSVGILVHMGADLGIDINTVNQVSLTSLQVSPGSLAKLAPFAFSIGARHWRVAMSVALSGFVAFSPERDTILKEGMLLNPSFFGDERSGTHIPFADTLVAAMNKVLDWNRGEVVHGAAAGERTHWLIVEVKLDADQVVNYFKKNEMCKTNYDGWNFYGTLCLHDVRWEAYQFELDPTLLDEYGHIKKGVFNES